MTTNEWRIWNEDVILDQIINQPPDVQDAVLAAIELLVEDPYDPPGIETFPSCSAR